MVTPSFRVKYKCCISGPSRRIDAVVVKTENIIKKKEMKNLVWTCPQTAAIKRIRGLSVHQPPPQTNRPSLFPPSPPPHVIPVPDRKTEEAIGVTLHAPGCYSEHQPRCLCEIPLGCCCCCACQHAATLTSAGRMKKMQHKSGLC